MFFYCKPTQPKQNLHIMLFGIADNLRQIDFRMRSPRITGGCHPSTVHQCIFQPQLRCKVYIIFISLRIGTHSEIYIINTGIPPFPTWFTRFYPTIIGKFTGCWEFIYHFILNQYLFVFRNHEETPGETSFSWRPGNIRGFFQNFEFVIIIVLETDRTFGKQGIHSIVTCTFQKHTGIIGKVGFRYQNLTTTGRFKQCRQISHDIILPVTFRLHTGINRLIRGGESMCFTQTGTIIGRKVDIEIFSDYLYRSFSISNETIGYTVIKNTKFYSIISRHIHAQIIIMIAHRFIFQGNLPLPAFIYRAFPHFSQHRFYSQCTIGKGHPHRTPI